jgi:hypothetical protein
MLGDGALTFREFVMKEPLPLATIHAAVLEFLQSRQDAVLFGAQAVNAYVDEPRMTQAVDILSNRADALAEELRAYLSERFQIAMRVRTVRGGAGYRLYQVRKPKNRHLVDIRSIGTLPAHEVIEHVLVVAPPELIAQKLLSMVSRPRTAKGLIDAADLRRLLIAFPELKIENGPVRECLRAAGATDAELAAWKDLVSQELTPDDEDAEFS